MNRLSSTGLAFALVATSVAGCYAPASETGTLQEMQAKILAAPRHASGLFMSLKQAPAPYSVKFIRQLDWDTAVATLTNTDGTIPVLTQTIAASVDATNARKATLSFTPVKPASGYTLTITLQRKDETGTPQTVATGTNAGFTINPGANAITVGLTANATGELLVDVSKPVLVLNTLTSNVATKSHFDVVRAAGDAAGGNALTTDRLTTSYREVSGMDIDASGNLYVADAGNNQIRKVPPTGAAATLLAGKSDGSSGFAGDGAAATTAALSAPRGLTRDPSTGNIFFCDSGNNRIRCISAADGKIYTIAGGGATTTGTSPIPYAVNAQLNQPWGIVADQSGNVYVTERGTGKVLKIDTTGQLTVIATIPSGAGNLGPIAIDRTVANGGLIWVGSAGNVKVITGAFGGSPTLSATNVFTASGTSPYVTGLAFDQLGTLFAEHTSDTPTAGATNTKIWRIPVDNTGAALSGRAAEAIAGTGATGTLAADYSVGTTPVPNANGQLLAGLSWCSLMLDMTAGLSGSTVSGQLYTGNSYSGAYGQVLKLTPSSL